MESAAVGRPGVDSQTVSKCDAQGKAPRLLVVYGHVATLESSWSPGSVLNSHFLPAALPSPPLHSSSVHC